MIGSVILEWQGKMVEATLEDDLTWTTVPETPSLKKMLDILFGRPISTSPANGRPGIHQLRSVAHHFNGKVIGLLPDDGPPGRVY